MTGMLPKVQNAIGELYLEIGMTQEGRLLVFPGSMVQPDGIFIQQLKRQPGLSEAKR